jgi:L-2-hydroxyglutarate oxidase LhgO
MEHIDVAVIGAGIVGLAVAAEMTTFYRTVVLLEKNESYGRETSSRNSEVIHSGIHYPTGSLKAALCVAGNILLFDLCEQHHIPCKRIGKLTVAHDEQELAYLHALKRQGEANGVPGLTMLDRKELRSMEPAVRAEYALWSPTTGIIDSHQMMKYYALTFKDRGGMFLANTAVTGIDRDSAGYALHLNSSDVVVAHTVVNAAGLAADMVASLAGIDIDTAGYRLSYYKGEYFSLNRPIDVSHLIYGVPSNNRGLGIHLVINMAGNLRLGPNALPVNTIEYDVDPQHKNEFWRQAQHYFDGICPEDLQPDTAGIRPKLAAANEFNDFIISEESEKGLPGFVNLIGIESPGLTSCGAIAQHVAKLISH